MKGKTDWTTRATTWLTRVRKLLRALRDAIAEFHGALQAGLLICVMVSMVLTTDRHRDRQHSSPAEAVVVVSS